MSERVTRKELDQVAHLVSNEKYTYDVVGQYGYFSLYKSDAKTGHECDEVTTGHTKASLMVFLRGMQEGRHTSR